MNNTCSKNRVREYLPGNWAEFDSLLNQVFGASRPPVARGVHAPASVWEDTQAYHLELDVPGVSRDGIELTLEKGTLQIVAERKRSEEDRTGLQEERAYGKASRSFTLPESVDPASIGAELKDGVLHVTLAKAPEKQPRHIEVK